jgi:hypothetical protein
MRWQRYLSRKITIEQTNGQREDFSCEFELESHQHPPFQHLSSIIRANLELMIQIVTTWLFS